ncbi:MAG: DivIVA domain-containing protein [Metamycoplasmataceae bacterium]
MKLNYKKIVEKKFETVINGYSPTQVDMFLDKICLDYMEYEKRINEFSLEVENLRNENISLTEHLIEIKNGITSEKQSEYQEENQIEQVVDNQFEYHEENQDNNQYESYAEYNDDNEKK